MLRARLFSALGALSILVSLAPAGRVGAQDRRVVRPEYGRFDVEVVVEGYTLDALYGRGRRYVEARDGSEYELVVRNPLPVRVAVALSVDGLNTIDARRTSAWESSKWVIEPYGTVRIKGWQTSSTNARRFYFTTERDSYAANLGRASDLGVITAVFYREAVPRRVITPKPPRPYYEEDGVDRRGRSEAPAEKESRANESARSGDSAGAATQARPRDDDGYAATGIGRSTRYDVDWIHMNLERAPAAEVTIRYEYRDALIRLGLLPRYYRDDEDALRRRERARGFEDHRYSPEPE
ncbi:MAG TPA: hypothetical protein VGP08_24355 [Pyrinomonadaceae bacterium]|jgi:hypothetical protein|nr:hypothetical protein [Pyrinomonadaceae bacterium]